VLSHQKNHFIKLRPKKTAFDLRALSSLIAQRTTELDGEEEEEEETRWRFFFVHL